MARQYRDGTVVSDVHALAAEAAIFVAEAAADAEGNTRSYMLENQAFPAAESVAVVLSQRVKPIWIAASLSGSQLMIRSGPTSDLDDWSQRHFDILRYQRPPNWYSFSSAFLLLSGHKSLKLPLDVLSRWRQDYQMLGYAYSQISARDGIDSLGLTPLEKAGIGGIIAAGPAPRITSRDIDGGTEITIA